MILFVVCVPVCKQGIVRFGGFCLQSVIFLVQLVGSCIPVKPWPLFVFLELVALLRLGFVIFAFVVTVSVRPLAGSLIAVLKPFIDAFYVFVSRFCPVGCFCEFYQSSTRHV